jgi:hypothetical protein
MSRRWLSISSYSRQHLYSTCRPLHRRFSLYCGVMATTAVKTTTAPPVLEPLHMSSSPTKPIPSPQTFCTSEHTPGLGMPKSVSTTTPSIPSPPHNASAAPVTASDAPTPSTPSHSTPTQSVCATPRPSSSSSISTISSNLSRPSTPLHSANILSRPSSPPPRATSKSSAPKKWNHLSHISVATWIGVGLTLAGLVVAVYYGIPMMRLTIWTAQNDFRESCKSDLEAGMPRTAACNKTLEQSPQPPPIRRRTITAMEDRSGLRLPNLNYWGLVICVVLLVAVWKPIRYLAHCKGENEKPTDTPVSSSIALHDIAKGSIAIATASQSEAASIYAERTHMAWAALKAALDKQHAFHLRNDCSSLNVQSVPDLTISTTVRLGDFSRCASCCTFQTNIGIVDASLSAFAVESAHLRNSSRFSNTVEQDRSHYGSNSSSVKHFSTQQMAVLQLAIAPVESTREAKEYPSPSRHAFDQRIDSARTTNEDRIDERVAAACSPYKQGWVLLNTRKSSMITCWDCAKALKVLVFESIAAAQSSTVPNFSVVFQLSDEFVTKSKEFSLPLAAFASSYLCRAFTSLLSSTASLLLGLCGRTSKKRCRSLNAFALIFEGLVASLATVEPYNAIPTTILLAAVSTWNLAWLVAKELDKADTKERISALPHLAFLFFTFLVYVFCRWICETNVFYALTGIIWTGFLAFTCADIGVQPILKQRVDIFSFSDLFLEW